MWVIKGKKSKWTRRRVPTTFIIGSCRPLRGLGVSGAPLSSCSRVEWKFMGRAQRNFSPSVAVDGVRGMQRIRVLAFRRRRMFPLMSGHARYRGVTMSVVVVVMLVMVVSQCYQLHRVMKTSAVGTASATAARRSLIPTRNCKSTHTLPYINICTI